ncbi:poly-beta-1,6-N-acetyl-D-glucosamine biosynthesis protein PgaD [Methylococcus sp. EFPC2]|uniref:poly-beta-1,6-N-acetyl-D-glucosamine biosynthesis protein PgaD n=1 Tax=Methylococcus sp. EFPC2 TaxID=2812648 RepID=UPI0019675F4B|nr:poly-beta-1,6-N-acetyl-D-glucosamine biosynthesis protein PgaD [Methylococcus sp. EFPC2]QSA98454.1 poly-beta-1,6-N-acetyl-D-glucosamine biosynthesis protein PgaD [Methylococcus sp. EFPC2]
MTELVINAPHLQTGRQRLGATAVSAVGWLLWCYLLFPLAALAGWLLNVEACSQWVNLSGGYLNLQEMLAIYGLTVSVMAGIWTCWVSYNAFMSRRDSGAQQATAVSLDDVCAAFGVRADDVMRCRRNRYAVVHFDHHGQIIGLE